MLFHVNVKEIDKLGCTREIPLKENLFFFKGFQTNSMEQSPWEADSHSASQ